MGVINVLDKKIYSQISAGEVVEKPASIVKELVENSLDAGAKNITVEITKGGIESISVTDDGCGIEHDDVVKAFMPHATSKLSKIEDLMSLKSMGFRGEALSSISAVTNVEMITNTVNQEIGTKVVLSGGDIVSCDEVASVVGTKITVSNLFFNTPARHKFLRKPKTEENEITHYIEKLMLSRSDVNFKYIIDSKIIYNTTQCSLLDVIYTIYGNEIASNLVEVDLVRDGYRVHGFIGKPCISKANRTYQSLFVNSRFCQNSMIGAAISDSYEDFAMKGKFPVYILFLELPPDCVDVNVHPNKLEVKFEDTRRIYGIFKDATFEALVNQTHIQSALADEMFNDLNEQSSFEKVDTSNIPVISQNEGISFSDFKKSNSIKEELIKSPFDINKISDPISFAIPPEVDLADDEEIFAMPMNPPTKEEIESQLSQAQTYAFERSNDLSEIKINNPLHNIKQNYIDLNEITRLEQQTYNNLFDGSKKIVGTAFNTYVIIEEGDKLYFIDQHAAHERILFDKLISQINSKNIAQQELLYPHILNLNAQEYSFIEDNLDAFTKCGFEIEEFGKNTFKVTTIPLILAEIDLQAYFEEILINLNKFVKKPIDVIRDKFATMACKAAVKGGQNLTTNEISTLVNTLKDEKTTLLCPHGRPVVIVFEKKQIEKMFKRIV